MTDGLRQDPEAPWDDLRKGLNQRRLAGLLGRFGIKSTTVRLADDTRAKGYKREDFEDAWVLSPRRRSIRYVRYIGSTKRVSRRFSIRYPRPR